jgi:SAM-dependent methyltransferase
MTGMNCLACGGELGAEPTLTAPDRMHGVAGSWAVHECTACGSGVTLPLVAVDALVDFYPGDYAPFEVPRGSLAAAMSRMQRLRDGRFPSEPLRRGRAFGRLLDVGCGRGDLAASWVAAGWEVLGVEPSSQAASVARRRGASVAVGTLDTVVLEAESVDAAVFRHSLEHVTDPRLDLRKVYAALRPGGRVAVVVPNWGSWQRGFFGQYWFPLELPRHRTHFSSAGLRAALVDAGFTEVEVRPGTPLITTVWSLQFRLFGRCLTNSGVALVAGYLVSVIIAPVALAVDTAFRSGDFLHATARRGG